MRLPTLAWRLPPALCGIAGVSFFSRIIGAFFFLSSQTFLNPENIVRLWGGWDARLVLLKMVLAFTILQDDGEGGMNILRVVKDGVGVLDDKSW